MLVSQSVTIALLIALGLGLANTALRLRYDRADFIGNGIATFVTFLVNFPFIWIVLYFGRPPLTGPMGGYIWLMLPLFLGWVVYLIADIIITAVSGGGFDTDEEKHIGSVVLLVPLALLVMSLWFGKVHVGAPFGGQEAKAMAGLLHVENQPTDAYPDTDTNHMVLVPEETAIYKANNVIGGAQDEQGRTLSSLYKPGDAQLQSVNNHLYWIFALEFGGWRNWKIVRQISPGYIVIDAEDPDAEAQLKTGYKMKYLPSAYFANSLSRLIYNTADYKHYNVDDPTLEVDDNWQPWFTVALDRPQVQGIASVPVAMITVNPETGEITKYPLDQIPDWVDRVYSQKTVLNMVNWWGNWNDPNAPWKWCCYSNANRFKAASDPVLVYTKGSQHPSWQVVMTSKSADTSSTGVLLVDARSNNARFYTVLSGTPIESAVLHAFQTTKQNLKNLQPRHPSMHRIYGQETWVVSYVSAAEGKNAAVAGEPFQGVGLLMATDVQGANVILASNKEQALSQYLQLLAGSPSTNAPEANSLQKDVTGTIKEIATQIENGNTVYLIWLAEDPAHVFKAASDKSIELAFAKAGDQVAIHYIDVGNVVVDVGGFNDLTLPIVQ